MIPEKSNFTDFHALQSPSPGGIRHRAKNISETLLTFAAKVS